MRLLGDLEIGVMFWAGRDPGETLREVKSLGAKCGQLGVPPELDLASSAKAWREALEHADFPLQTVFCAYEGESYTDIPTVERTVGFVPKASRKAREQRTLDASDFAEKLGIGSIATHIGCLPEDSWGEDYLVVRGMVRRVCDHAAKRRQTFALETGQESAERLLAFLHDVNRENLGINFDPANMILYGTGDPIEALGVLGQHVISVHAKDGDWPRRDVSGALGQEKPLGQGAVGIENFVKKLKRIGYRGQLNVEREASDPVQRLADIRAGVALLEKLKDA